MTPARVVSGPTLLTGFRFCATCAGAMTLRTGKGNRYRYYTYSIRARQGDTGCTGRSVSIDKLDNLVASTSSIACCPPSAWRRFLPPCWTVARNAPIGGGSTSPS